MATVWTVCGAGRGVGKTHLALALCEILPNCVYAKLGHRRSLPNKPRNYFQTPRELSDFADRARETHDHLVVESDLWAREGRGDIIIFIGPIEGQTDVREDTERLRANAIEVGPASSTHVWKRALRAKLADEAIVARVCSLLSDQKRFLASPGLSVRTKVWFVSGGEHVFGSGLAQVLSNVERLESLAEAARTSRISYRCAWDLVKRAEARLGRKLLIPQTGGAGGGRSALTIDGKRLLQTYDKLNREVAEFADRRFAAWLKGKGEK